MLCLTLPAGAQWRDWRLFLLLHVQAGQDSRRNGLTDLPLDIGLVLAPAIERDSKHFLELAECE